MTFHFDYLQQLRSGGNADLWLARLRDTGALVVVKHLRERQDPTARRWFAREIRILERNFAGTIRYVGRDQSAEPLFYVMSYMPHGPASQWAGRANAEQLIFFACDLASALSTLHAAGIAHGDVKPDNVLLGDGRWHLADPLGNGWGCTKILSPHTGGTPGYWAPEIRSGRPISAAGDSYSFGATLYHMATGQVPVDGMRLDLLAPRLPITPKIRELIANCCQQEAFWRPSMQDVLRILRGERLADIRGQRAFVGIGLALFAMTMLAKS